MINTEKDCRKVTLGNNDGNTNDAKEIERKKETFVATLTHDLKTPTVAQIRMLELLLDGTFGELSPEQKEVTEQMLKSAKYMLQMISRVLHIYKFENGNIPLEYQTFDLKELLVECTKELSPLSCDRNLEFEIKTNKNQNKQKKNDTVVSADKIQIRRALVNLISNSIFYANKHTKIEIDLEQKDENIVFTVTNSSPYIPPDILNTLFDKYVSSPLNSKPNSGGCGLGLYLTERIIKAHEGKMIAESSRDNKNTFGFIMPKNSCSKEG